MPNNKRSDRMLNAATNEALRSAMRYRHGAVITKGGKILAMGHNHVRTGFSGPLSAHQAITLPAREGQIQDDSRNATSGRTGHSHNQHCFSMHAEMHAITAALKGAKPHVAKSNVLLEVSNLEIASSPSSTHCAATPITASAPRSSSMPRSYPMSCQNSQSSNRRSRPCSSSSSASNLTEGAMLKACAATSSNLSSSATQNTATSLSSRSSTNSSSYSSTTNTPINPSSSSSSSPSSPSCFDPTRIKPKSKPKTDPKSKSLPDDNDSIDVGAQSVCSRQRDVSSAAIDAAAAPSIKGSSATIIAEGARREQKRFASTGQAEWNENAKQEQQDPSPRKPVAGPFTSAAFERPRAKPKMTPAEKRLWLETRKQEKRERKMRGIMAASSSSSSSGGSVGTSFIEDLSKDLESMSSSSSSHPQSGLTNHHPGKEEDLNRATKRSDRSDGANVVVQNPFPKRQQQQATTGGGGGALFLRKPRSSAANGGRKSRSDEMSDSRLRGADLYVVRLMQDTESKAKAKEQRKAQRAAAAARGGASSAGQHQVNHHERRAAADGRKEQQESSPRYADSRPCWRCLEWMSWAGIKRVYWTNVNGDWEGGKVSILLDGEEADSDGYVRVHMTQYEHAALLRAQQSRL
ncbi:hypothetical protein IE53DRAFT_377410 [Violaceomyces palustris]|uniref:Uncharacterized protein n=1 Tax=Violaceomyces palustris TaxID=1673888 RepID=A0ACD0P5N0_9BASI|nr:hypothetical protein IE53DRAFT_377410 [Violaceomyces palustris]